jgi:hypothetical protein
VYVKPNLALLYVAARTLAFSPPTSRVGCPSCDAKFCPGIACSSCPPKNAMVKQMMIGYGEFMTENRLMEVFKEELGEFDDL